MSAPITVSNLDYVPFLVLLEFANAAECAQVVGMQRKEATGSTQLVVMLQRGGNAETRVYTAPMRPIAPDDDRAQMETSFIGDWGNYLDDYERSLKSMAGTAALSNAAEAFQDALLEYISPTPMEWDDALGCFGPAPRPPSKWANASIEAELQRIAQIRLMMDDLVAPPEEMGF